MELSIIGFLVVRLILQLSAEEKIKTYDEIV